MRFDNAPARQHGARYRDHGWWRDTTFVDDLCGTAARTPDKPAIIAARAFARDTITLTYRELARRVDHIASGLIGLGVRREDIVAIQLPNWWQLVATALACARIGAVIAPIPVDYRRREVEFILARTEAVAYVGPTAWVKFSHRDLIRELAPGLPALRHRVHLELADPGPGELDFDAWLAATTPMSGEDLDRRAPGADDVFLVMYTSGTTGEPKGVVHAYNTLYAITRAVTETAAITGDDVVTSPSSVTGMIGFLYDFLVPIHNGATAVFADLGDPDRGLALIEQHKISFVYAIPSYVASLIDAHQRRPRAIASLRVIVTGSAVVPPHLIGAARDVLGVRVQTLWGMTEIGGTTFTSPDDPPDWPAHSDGRPCAWMEIQIADRGADGSGRLRVRGANQCLGYFQRPDMYAAVVDGDGWFDTGDLVRDDGRGGIRIVGRVKDVIIRNGHKVPVLEVEAALSAHPQVAMVALVGDPDPQVGERVCAVIVAREATPTLGELREHLRATGMSAQYWPDRLHVVGAMPLTANGKIQKYVLQDQLRAAASP
ncbi:MAG TPA: AMP-binding protein [Kofleriaceae bacterium]|nr:AMP-binding protein [Kofleriaceae bacterium]